MSGLHEAHQRFGAAPAIEIAFFATPVVAVDTVITVKGIF